MLYKDGMRRVEGIIERFLFGKRIALRVDGVVKRGIGDV